MFARKECAGRSVRVPSPERRPSVGHGKARRRRTRGHRLATTRHMGVLMDILAVDHLRLDELLRAASSADGRVAPEPYAEFRRRLLRHIGLEEKILFPAARASRAIAEAVFLRAREDHVRLVSLMVPSPTPALVAEVRALLEPHNRMEEDAGGLYDLCERAIGAGAPDVAARLRAAPAVPTRPHSDRIVPRPSHLGSEEGERRCD